MLLRLTLYLPDAPPKTRVLHRCGEWVLGRASECDVQIDHVSVSRRHAQMFDDGTQVRPLVKGGPMLRIVGIKCFLDGGMLTGSAYMREPWGVSSIYSIDDPAYRGLLYIPHEKLVPMVRAAAECGLQFTAHSVGDGAVHALLAAYEEVNKSTPIAATRPCLTHSNFMSKEAVEKAAKLGVVCDIQPAWLWLDGETLRAQFGDPRLRYFQPHKSLFAAGVTVGGGSDHMGEQRFNHEEPVARGKAAIVLRAEGGRLLPRPGGSVSEGVVMSRVRLLSPPT